VGLLPDILNLNLTSLKQRNGFLPIGRFPVGGNPLGGLSLGGLPLGGHPLRGLPLVVLFGNSND